MSNCLVGARLCSFLLQYEGSNFCVSEILREGCQVQKLEQLDQLYDEKGEVNFSVPFPHKMETGLLLSGKNAPEFKFYRRNRLTRSAVFLGKIIERSRKESEDNLKGLLSKE